MAAKAATNRARLVVGDIGQLPLLVQEACQRMNRTLSFALGSSSVTAEWTTADVSHLHDRVGEILYGRNQNVRLLRSLAEWPAANGRREPVRFLRCYSWLQRPCKQKGLPRLEPISPTSTETTLPA